MAQTNCEAPPELWSVPRKQYMVAVFVAIAAKGLSELNVVGAVRATAPERLFVWAFTVSGASWMAAPRFANSMNWPEAGCSQCDEYLRVISHGCGYVVMPTVQAGVDELPCIASVQIRA
jgi:hypothetical protein